MSVNNINMRIRLVSTTLALCVRWQTCTGFQSVRRAGRPLIRLQQTASCIVSDATVDLGTGVSAQILSSNPTKSTSQKLPPLVFIHGSFHGAWCWSENYFDYFVDLGYPVAALSLRGTGGTFAGEGVKKVKIEEHAQDLRALLQRLDEFVSSSSSEAKPVLISHSFGGLAVMKHLELHPSEANDLSGIITMCSVPPSGNGKMTMRFLRRSLVQSYKITAGFAMKKCIQNDELCRDLFFGGPKVTRDDGTVDDHGVSDADIKRYQGYFERDTVATIDLLDLSKNLPDKTAVNGKAPGIDSFPPCLVMGATDDFIVDREGLDETATYFDCQPPLLVDSPHDVMLGNKWKNGAAAIHEWITEKIAT